MVIAAPLGRAQEDLSLLLQPTVSLRTNGWLGYLANKQVKLQVGAEYRVVEAGRNNRSFLFMLTSLVFSLQ